MRRIWVGSVWFFTFSVMAQTGAYPVKPIRVIIPAAPGGSIDGVMRLLVPKMTESLGQSVVLESRPGASTNMGNEYVARAPADGYTLLANTLPLVANVSLFTKLGYDPEKDYAPICLVATAPSFVAVHPSVPAKSVAEFINLAKAHPQTVKYSTSGAGGITHLSLELLAFKTGTHLVHVPYKGGGPALLALMSGEVDVSFVSAIAASGFMDSGRLRLLAVTSAKRLPIFPKLPTVAESGVPDYEFNSWVGVLAPLQTPVPIVKLLHEHLTRAARAPDIVERFAKDGAVVIASTPEAFKTQVSQEVALWAKVIRQAGIKAD
jgi:tripartite-type tricarboxylate transporter receptor subunit TctC